jgi:predicted phage tail protein
MGNRPKEAKNTLRSRSVARVLDVLGEGEIEVIDGDKGVYLDKTVLEEQNGRRNFTGIRTTFKNGTKNQTAIRGMRAVENEVNVGAALTKSGGAITRTIGDLDADSVLIKIRVSALSKTDNKSGDINPTKVALSVYRKNNGGSFVKVRNVVISGKTNSQYERAILVDLPSGNGPWDIKVERDTADSNNSFLRNETFFSSYTIIYETKLTYPYSALCYLEVDAKKFGNSFPERRYEVRRINAPYPSNWNPNTRNYSGVWDGTFLTGTHDNPAWYLYELGTNNVFGLGDLLTQYGINKWNLYTIAQYCDELVGGKPRFTLNGYVATRTQAIRLIDTLASVFRGMTYWSAGAVDFTQDRPTTPTKLITPANTIDGTFNRVSSSRKARHTSVIVGWNNPKMLGDIDYVIVTRDDLVSTFGYRPKEVSAFGCTDEDQARRVGEWILDTEENETEVITWRASFDQLDALPGEHCWLHDPAYQGARFGGRIVSLSGVTVTVDDLPTLSVGPTYEINVMMDDGTIETRTISSYVGDVVTVTVAFTGTPVDNAIWTINSDETTGEHVRITGVFEKSLNVYEVQALKHDPTKFARVERDRVVEHPDYTIIPTGALAMPLNLEIDEFFTEVNDEFQSALMIGWEASPDARTTAHEYQWAIDDGDLTNRTLTDAVGVELHDVGEGLLTFQVRAVAGFAVGSDWLVKQVSVMGANAKPNDVAGFKCSVAGTVAKLRWTKNTDALTKFCEVRFSPLLTGATWEGAVTVAEQITRNSSELATVARVGTYLIKAVTKTGRYSQNAATVVNKVGVRGGVLGGVVDESTDWFGLDAQAVFGLGSTSDFTLSECVKTGITAATTLNIRETAVTSVHKAEFPLNFIEGKNSSIEFNFYCTPVGTRNIRYRISDAQGNFVSIDVNLSTRTTVTSSSSGFVSPSFTVSAGPMGSTQTLITFDTLESSTGFNLEINILSGASSSYLGVITSGINFNNATILETNNTLVDNGASDLEFAADGSGYVQNAYYVFANAANGVVKDPSISLAAKSNVKFKAQFEYTTNDDGGVIGDLAAIGDSASIGGQNVGIVITPQVRSANTLTGYLYDYGEWEDLTDAYFSGRYFQFRFLITSINPLLTPTISAAQIEWEVPEYIESGASNTNGPARRTITFANEFVEIPAIQVTPEFLPTGGYIQVDNKATTSFRVGIFNSAGTQIDRDFDWVATGNGPVIP